MRSPQKSNRPRGRGSRKGGGGGGSNVNRVFESSGPEGKVRGTAQQIIDKYLTLARDAQTAGDRVNGENFLQHAEHYQRVLALALGQQQERREQSQSDEDDGSEEEAREQQEEREPQQEREQRPARAERPRREKSADSSVDGMQTIDANEGEGGPDLLVGEETGSGRTRRRRSTAARSKSENEDTAAESAAE